MICFWPFTIKRRTAVYGITCVVFIGLVFGLLGFEFADELDMAALDKEVQSKSNAAPSGTVSLVVKLSERVLEVYSDGDVFKTYRIAVGKSSTPSPLGEWQVVWKDYNWGTGFGTRWMGLNVSWGIYGIHGTNKPWSIGQFASHGCIRMRNKDVEELFEWVPVGTSVKVIGKPIKVQRELKYQMIGSDVVIVQLKLKELGYLAGRADGIFGKSTEQAVRRYQEEQGLEITGVVNRKLIGLLDL